MSVMTELTTKSTREYGFNIISPLAFVVIAPLGVLVSLILVAPRGFGVVGDGSRLDQDCCYSYSFLSSYYCLLDGVGWRYSIVQNSGTVEQRKVEQNSPLLGDVGVRWVVEGQERGSMDFVVVLIHRVHRKAMCFH